MNLLIVDDHLINLKLLRAQLESEGHVVSEAHDGVDALALLERQRVDAVISDILMPQMDGYSLCYEIRKRARLRDLPIIIYSSAYTSPGDEKLALEMGADKYLKKPASVETIITALHEVIAQPHAAPQPDALREVEVLKKYNERLVSKLKEKNAELEQSLAALQRAHDHIVELNTDLEHRVKERTAGLAARNKELTEALAEVKQLRGILPICSYCKKIRDDKDYWQSVEGYISHHTGSQFSHGICPECYEKHVQPELDKLKREQGHNE
jgi:CheY-like chemotaxis protein